MELDGSPIPLSDLVSYFAGRRPPPSTTPIAPPDGDGKAYCAPAPPPDPPRPPAPPQPPPFPPRAPETSGPGGEEIGNGEVRRHLASAAAAAAAEAAIAADGVFTATGHAPLTHLLGSWRPEGWSWHHDIWLQVCFVLLLRGAEEVQGARHSSACTCHRNPTILLHVNLIYSETVCTTQFPFSLTASNCLSWYLPAPRLDLFSLFSLLIHATQILFKSR